MAKSKKKKAEIIEQLFNNTNGSMRQKWQQINQKGHDFYLDNQLTQEEATDLREQGMPDFTINRIIPVVEVLTFFATANNPAWKAVGREGSDTTVAGLFSDMASYIWNGSNGPTIYAQVISDAITKSMGVLQVIINPDADKGMGEVEVKPVDAFDVFVDPKSRDPLFRDAAYIFIRKILSKTHLYQMFPEFITKIKKASGKHTNIIDYSSKRTSDNADIQPQDIVDAWTIEGENDEIVELYELYKKQKIAFMNVFYKVPPSPEEMQQMQQQAEMQIQKMQEEMSVAILEKQKQIQEAVQAGEIIPERAELELKKAQEEMQMALQNKQQEIMLSIQEQAQRTAQKVISEKEFKVLLESKDFKESLIDAIKFYETRITLTCVAGDQILYEDIVLPGEEYPLVPFTYKWTGTPYPMSSISPLIGKQQEINKAHQLMIHNASLASSLRWIYEEGSIDEDYWTKYGAAPGALLKMNPGFEKPTPVMPQPLSNAFGNVVQMGKMDMEHLSGIYSQMQGDISASKDMPYRGLLANDEYGTRRVKQWMQNSIEPALKQLGTIIMNYSQVVYTAQKVFRIVEPNNIVDSKEVQINVPIYNDYGEMVGKFNDYATAKFDIQIVAGSTLPVNRWAYLEELKGLMQMGIIDDIAVLAEADIKNKEKIAARKSLYAQLQGQLGQLQEAMKDKEGTIETLERQLVQAGIKNKVMQASVEINKKKEEVKSDIESGLTDSNAKQKVLQGHMTAKSQLEQEKMGLATQSFVKELDRTIQEKKDLTNDTK